MADFDLDLIADAILDAVSAPMAAQAKRIDDLEKTLADERAKPKALSAEEIAALVAAEVERRVSALPAPQPGKDVDMAEVRAILTEAVAALPPPEPGKSVDPEDIARMVAVEVQKEVAALPEPKPGRDGLDVTEMFRAEGDRLIAVMSDGTTRDLGVYVGKDGVSVDQEAVAEIVRAEVKKAVAHMEALGREADPDLLPRLVDEAVSKAVAEIPPPKDGDPGKDADPEFVKALVAETVTAEVTRQVEAMPKPKDGSDVDPDEVARMVTMAVDDAVSTLPVPKDGNSVTLEDVAPVIAEAVQKAVAAIPAPKDGETPSPEEIDRIVTERVEKAIADMPKPKDGLDCVNLMRDEQGHLIAVMSDGSTKDLGEIDGKDGFGFDDMEIDYDGERNFVLRFARGEVVKEFPARLPIIIDRGVYKEAATYERGDAVTFGGGMWICQVENAEAKPGTNGDWRLAVKSGRPGRDGRRRDGDK